MSLKTNYFTLLEKQTRRKSNAGQTLKNTSINKLTFRKRERSYWPFSKDFIQKNTVDFFCIHWSPLNTFSFLHFKIILNFSKNFCQEFVKSKFKLHSNNRSFLTKIKKTSWLKPKCKWVIIILLWFWIFQNFQAKKKLKSDLRKLITSKRWKYLLNREVQFIVGLMDNRKWSISTQE